MEKVNSDSDDASSSKVVPAMDIISAELIIHVIAYLNVFDQSRLSTSSRRMYYLVDQFRGKILGPELVASSDHSESGAKSTPGEVLRNGLFRLRSQPNVAFCFFSNSATGVEEHIENVLPRDTYVLGSMTENVQTNCEGEVDSQSDFAVMLGSLCPERTTFLNFNMGSGIDSDDRPLSHLQRKLFDATPDGLSASSHWKIFVVYVCGEGYYYAEEFVAELQNIFPEASIAGGICDGGLLRGSHPALPVDEEAALQSKTVRQLKKIIRDNGMDVGEADDSKEELILKAAFALQPKAGSLTRITSGIFGLAIGGDVPTRTVVSRGMRSVMSGTVGQGTSRWVVVDTTLVGREEESYPFMGDSILPAVHLIRRVQDTETKEVIDALKCLVSAAPERPEFVGLQRPTEDGFALHMIGHHTASGSCLAIMTDGSTRSEESYAGSSLDFFRLDGPACLEDMDITLARLKEQTKEERLLGAIMFSCSGRGPSATGLITEEMADATRFFNHFPHIPCLGFYAGGEIGPEALAGNQNIFQVGRASVQGFTAVFVVFVVPHVEPGITIDDSPDSIALYLQTKKPS